MGVPKGGSWDHIPFIYLPSSHAKRHELLSCWFRTSILILLCHVIFAISWQFAQSGAEVIAYFIATGIFYYFHVSGEGLVK